MNRKLLFAIFCAVAALQLAVPASMILGQERVLSHGRAYKFQCMPIDPYDPFRGKYVTLSFSEQSGPLAPGTALLHEQKAYASLTEDSDGFAHISLVSSVPPDSGDYVAVDVQYVDMTTAHIRLPFDRYYMNEFDAPAAEQAYREHTRADAVDAYAVVRVREGVAVIERLFVGGMPVEEFIRQAQPETSEF